MKKTITLLGLLFSTFCFSQIFPGEDIQLLTDKDIVVLPKSETLQKYGYDDFYKDEKLKTKYDCCESYNSKYKSLVGKTFKVLSYEPYTNLIGSSKYKLKIENNETGIIYFDYDPRYDFKYPFDVVGGLDLPSDFYCKKIKVSTDKFTGDVSYSTEYSEGISVIKVEKDKVSKIYLAINEQGPTLNVGAKGLILLLTNNKRINKPDAKIEVKVNKGGSGYIYSAFVELNSQDLNLLKENIITDNRLYVYDGEIKNGEKIKEYVKCLAK
ncbi:hypothetical protein EV143_104390 [Flavobacterium chryseum]|uniref:hypothetical protein n=1 Tax=Flavobacterium sp. P3160 TaxID=2512113 RepID=UPI00105E9A09|nr:hypothetical protein [Flavobacterium sp. P3160]TDO77623.1 hypothetical protein EV143_104390 [Flavobacterium sp. P3160]